LEVEGEDRDEDFVEVVGVVLGMEIVGAIR
jgi:hypothetical protein